MFANTEAHYSIHLILTLRAVKYLSFVPHENPQEQSELVNAHTFPGISP